VLEVLLARCQAVLVGGGLANTFLAARGMQLGASLVETEQIGAAERILLEARRKRVRIMLPTDAVIAPQIHHRARTRVVPVAEVPRDQIIVDIGPETVAAFTAQLVKAKTVFWNGPMGVFEIRQFAEGTNAIARFLAGRTDAGVTTIVGGGDSVAAVEQLGLSDRITHVSTGGGASLEFIEGKTLPGVAALRDREEAHP
jgi:phosphoglycerate kinase